MRGNVALTPAGEALLPLARRVLTDVEGAESEVRDLTGMRRGRLSVGATPSLSTTLIPPALSRYHQSYPGIELVLHEAGSRDLVGELEQGVLDVALVILPMHHDILETTPLLREELVLAVPKSHALAQRRNVSIAELRGVPLVMFRDGYDLRATTVAACRRAGFEPTFALEGGEMDGVLRLTAAGVGVAVVPSLVVERGGPLRAVRIAKPELTRTIGFAHRRDRRLTRPAQEFVTTVRGLVAAREWLARTPAGLTVLDGAAAPRTRRATKS